MASTFIALPLTSGDAFLLRTDDEGGREWNILVDSGKKYGKNSRELADILSQISPRVDHIDIAVCTHQDADHANGFWFFAEDWYDLGRTIGEYWLPGRWANAMPEILTDPAAFSASLALGAEQASGILLDQSFSEIAAESPLLLSSEKLNILGSVSEEDEKSAFNVAEVEGEPSDSFAASFGLDEGEFERLQSQIDETDDMIDPLDVAIDNPLPASIAFRNQFRLKYFFPDFDEEEIQKLHQLDLETRTSYLEAMDVAKAIRKISLSAINHDIKVRWFDFGEFKKTGIPKGGKSGVLEPLCAVEVQPKPKTFQKMSNMAMLVSLRLSKQNVESLVFYRPENDAAPGVLFLGDTRLAYGVNRPEENFDISHDAPKRPIIVTAPHHGSNKNDRAYEVLDSWLGGAETIFIRNGGQSNQKLDEYRNREKRRCAQCVQCHGKNWNQWVAVNEVNSDWLWPPKANACGTPRR